MQQSRRRNSIEEWHLSTGSGQRVYINASTASQHASPRLERTNKSFHNSHSIVSDASTEAMSSFLTVDYKEEISGSPSVEVTYPSRVNRQQQESLAWREYEESLSYNNKQMVSTPSTEPMNDSGDADSFFPYLGRSASSPSPPKLENQAGDTLPTLSSREDADGSCFEFPYLGRSNAPFNQLEAIETKFRKVDPDGRLARNLCNDDFPLLSRRLVQSFSPETTLQSEDNEQNSTSLDIDNQDHLMPCSSKENFGATVNHENDDGIMCKRFFNANELGGSTTPSFPYLSRIAAHASDNVKDEDGNNTESMQTTNPSTNCAYNSTPIIPFLCRGMAPSSPVSAVIEIRNDDDAQGGFKLPDCISGTPLAKQVQDQDDVKYYDSSAYSPASSDPCRHDELKHELFNPLHDYVNQCIHSYGVQSVRTGQAYLHLGTAYFEEGSDIHAAQRAFTLAYRTFEHKPLAKALVLEKLSHVANIQASKDAKYLSRAYDLLLESFRLRQEHLGKLHADTVNTLNQLARFHRRSGNLQESCRLLVQVYHARKQIFGSLHPSCAVAAHDLANVLVQLHQLDEAKKFYRVAVTIYEKMHVPVENPAVAKLMKDLHQIERVGKRIVQKPRATPSGQSRIKKGNAFNE
jgi:tetratricopeptide (TPR) repeat protein